MNEFSPLRVILHGLLGLTMVVAALVFIYRSAVHFQRMRTWNRVQAISRGSVEGSSIRVEVDGDSDNLVTLAKSPLVLYRAAEPIPIALDPANPGQAVPMDFAHLGRRLGNPLMVLLAAVIAWINLSRSPFGRDLTRQDGQWVATAPGAPKPGTEPGAVRLNHSRAGKAMAIFWLLLFGFCAVGAAFGAFRSGSMIQTMATLLATGVASIAAYSVLSSRTGHFWSSEASLVETDAVNTRRIPWTEIAGLKKRNINEEAQRSYDRSDITRFQKGASRPPTLYVNSLVDSQGREIMTLPDSLVPAAAFEELCQRAQKKSK